MALVSTGEASTLVRPVSNIAGPPPRASEHDFAPLLQLRSTLGAVVLRTSPRVVQAWEGGVGLSCKGWHETDNSAADVGSGGEALTRRAESCWQQFAVLLITNNRRQQLLLAWSSAGKQNAGSGSRQESER